MSRLHVFRLKSDVTVRRDVDNDVSGDVVERACCWSNVIDNDDDDDDDVSQSGSHHAEWISTIDSQLRTSGISVRSCRGVNLSEGLGVGDARPHSEARGFIWGLGCGLGSGV